MSATVTVTVEDPDGRVQYEIKGPIHPLVDVYGAVNDGITKWIDSAREAGFEIEGERLIDEGGEERVEEL